MKGFRQSIQDLIDSSKPDSPTDVIFLFGGIVLVLLWIYATIFKTSIPQITEVIGFLVLCKGVKAASDKINKGVLNDTTTDVKS